MNTQLNPPLDSSDGLEVLQRLSQHLNEQVALEPFLDEALRLVLEAFGLKTGWISLWDGKRGFYLAASRGLPPAMQADDYAALRWSPCTCQQQLLEGTLKRGVNILHCERMDRLRQELKLPPEELEQALGGIRVHASIPLKSGERILGILNLARPGDAPFDEAEMSLLTTAGEIIGTAVDRARLYEQLHQERDIERRVLVRFARTLALAETPHQVADDFLEEVRRALGIGCAALVLELDDGTLSVVARGFPEDALTVDRATMAHLRDQSASSETPLLISPCPFTPSCHHVHDSLMVSLNAPERLLGFLCVYDLQGGRFDEHTRHLLVLLASQGAAALRRTSAFQALKASEERFRTLYESVPVGLFRCTADGRILAANRRLVELFGYPSRDALLQVNARDLYLDPSDWDRWHASLTPVQDIIENQTRFRRYDGSTWWGQVRMRVRRRPDGTILYHEGAIFDITARKEAEQLLEREQARLSLYNHILALILEQRDLSTLLQRVLDELVNYLGVELGGVYLIEGDRAVLYAGRGLPDHLRADYREFSLRDVADEFRWPKVIADPESRERYLGPQGNQLGVRSGAIIPLVMRKEDEPPAWLGTLLLGSYRDGAFTAEDIQPLQDMASQIALAVHYLRLQEQASTRLTRLSILHEIDKSIMQRLDLERVIDVVLRHIPATLGADVAAISLLGDDEDGARVFRIRFMSGEVASSNAFELSDALLHDFKERQEPVIIPDVSQDPRVQTHLEGIRTWRLVSYLGVPLVSAGKTIGILHILTTTPRRFSPEDVSFFATLAGQAAVAIQNARAFAWAREQAEAVRIMLEAQIEIAAATSPEAVALPILLQALRRALRAKRVAFFRYEAERGRLVLAREETESSSLGEGEVARLEFVLGEERGLVGLVGLSQEAVYLPECQKDPRWIVRDSSIRSAYLVPFRFRDRLIGVLSMESEMPRAFPEARRHLADLFVHYSAVTTEEERLLLETRRRARFLTTLNEIISAAAAATDIDALLDTTLGRILSVLEVDAGSFWIFGHAKTCGLPAHFGTQVGRAAAEADMDIPEPLATPDWHEVGDEYPQGALKPLMEQFGLYSSMTVPVLVEGTRVGGLSIACKRPRVWTAEEITLLEAIGREAGAAAMRIQLFQQAEERAERLARLAQVSEGINRRQGVAPIADAIIHGAMQLFNADACALFVVEDESTLSCPGFAGLSSAYVEKVLRVGRRHFVHDYLAQKQPFIVPDVRRLPKRLQAQILAIEEGFRSLIAWPLLYEGATMAALVCYYREPHEVSVVEKQIMGNFARQAAVAFENARLYDRLVRTNEQLREALRAREDMLRNVTHELRTPLTMVKGYAELMTMGIITDPAEVEETAGVILKQSQHLEHLINQLLLLQQVRHQEMDVGPIRVKDWLDNAVAAWRLPMQERGITLSLTVDPDVDTVMGHVDYLTEALNNLLENARKFSPDGGHVRVRCWQDADHVYISVSDEGIGIPRDKLERIFERFYQVDASTTRRFEGTGIGLSLVRDIVERHGGRVVAESEGPGKGATFTITLPRPHAV